MKTRSLLQKTGLAILIMLLTTLITNAQIPIVGLAEDNEGIAVWDANGSGNENEAYGHTDPFSGFSSCYYAASRNYVDPNPNAAMCHFLDDISGFPQFVQALSDNGFTVEQVRAKVGLSSQEDDLEGEDWFTHNNVHYFNRYDGRFTIELDGDPMIYGYLGYIHVRNESGSSVWTAETNFSKPRDESLGSTPDVQAVASAFLADVGNEGIRFTMSTTSDSTEVTGNGRSGWYFNVDSGYIEKGVAEILFEGFAESHEGLAVWDADGTGPEPENSGHNGYWEGKYYSAVYYGSGCGYDDIDPDPDACIAHLTEIVKGFPNIAIQLEYLGYTIDQIKAKMDLSTLGNDEEGLDWGIDTVNQTHWFNYYGGYVTFEIDGEPLFGAQKDTTYTFDPLDSYVWYQYTTYMEVDDLSEAEDMQKIVNSLTKDVCNRELRFIKDGYYFGDIPDTNGRSGTFHNIWGSVVVKPLEYYTHIGIFETKTQEQLLLEVFPNPVISYVNIVFNAKKAEQIEISIYNQLGEKIRTINKHYQPGKQTISWDASGLPSGIYFIQFQSGQYLISRKVIKL